jgi:hypothetical protein
MPTFIKAGFWEKTCNPCNGYKGWLNLDQFVGQAGSSGTSGTSGIQGVQGVQGSQGVQGTQGIQGVTGSAGTSGSSGAAGDQYRTTSTTEFTLGTGGTITIGTGLAYTVAQDISIAYDITHHQVSEVVSYNPGTGVLVFGTPSETIGSGTFSSWNVNLNGAAGGDGSSGTSGLNGSSGTNGIQGSQGIQGIQGVAGSNGTSGTTGTSGSSGSNGSSGTAGTSGTSGINGAASGYLGSFYDTTNQTGVAGSVLTMGLNNSDSWNNGVSIVSGNRITIANPGIYNLAFSAQMVKNSGNSATHAHIWLSQNGTDVPITGSQIGFPSNSVYVVAAWNFFVKTTVPNEYVQLKWEINSNVDNGLVITSALASGNIPAIPGLIVTVNQVG